MSFKKPEEDDEGQTFEEGQSPSGGSASITEETVRFGDEEVTVADALRLAGDMLTEPEEFGLVTADRVRKLEERNKRLAEKNERLRSQVDDLRSDMASLWMVESQLDGEGRYVLTDGDTGFLPSSFTSTNPGGELQDE
jgi:hypothetical protein